MNVKMDTGAKKQTDINISSEYLTCDFLPDSKYFFPTCFDSLGQKPKVFFEKSKLVRATYIRVTF